MGNWWQRLFGTPSGSISGPTDASTNVSSPTWQEDVRRERERLAEHHRQEQHAVADKARTHAEMQAALASQVRQFWKLLLKANSELDTDIRLLSGECVIQRGTGKAEFLGQPGHDALFNVLFIKILDAGTYPAEICLGHASMNKHGGRQAVVCEAHLDRPSETCDLSGWFPGLGMPHVPADGFTIRCQLPGELQMVTVVRRGPYEIDYTGDYGLRVKGGLSEVMRLDCLADSRTADVLLRYLCMPGAKSPSALHARLASDASPRPD